MTVMQSVKAFRKMVCKPIPLECFRKIKPTNYSLQEIIKACDEQGIEYLSYIKYVFVKEN